MLPAASVSTTVRVDARNGRLVRSVLVTSRTVVARVVTGTSKLQPASVGHKAAIKQLIDETAQKHDVDPLLVHSLVQVESNYDPRALSPKGAQGLMQLMPATARQYGVENSFDARQNLEGGLRYLKYLQSLFADERLVLAAYNAGEGAVAKYRWVPPYRETQHYVYEVGRRYGVARREQGAQRMQKTPVADSREPAPKPIEEYVDAEGRIHLRIP